MRMPTSSAQASSAGTRSTCLSGSAVRSLMRAKVISGWIVYALFVRAVDFSTRPHPPPTTYTFTSTHLMATFYSSFFSSGLLAAQPPTPSARSASPSTPRPAHSALPTDPTDHDTTPTAQDFAVSRASHAQASDTLPTRTTAHSKSASHGSTDSAYSQPSDDGRPRLRRRRSSLTTHQSPLASIKSNTAFRTAATAQRQSMFVSRARSGSDVSACTHPTDASSLAGRLRSGSVGNALRSRRAIRRSTAPPPPPPTAPLPAPPFSTPASVLPIQIPTVSASPPSTPRRPLARRVHTTHNTLLSASPAPSLPPTPGACALEDDWDCAMPSSPGYALGLGVPSSPAMGERGKTGPMQLDYPSPVDGPVRGCLWADRDAEMKEN
ncbi:hypothetical protein AcV7_003244 [Taiwanofungus camphoratus]|nr:hypothetical protein AcV7_003244 [Antrodia cinnamomea]